MKITGLMSLAVLAGASTPGLALAQDPDWPSMPYTQHAELQAIDGSGNGTFPTDHAIKMRGVLLNWPGDMLDTRASAEPFLGGQWQEYIQAVDAGDFGGSALWMGQFYGHLPFIGDPSDVYTDAQWKSELHRLDYDPLTGRLFRPGDLVEIRARAPGLFHNGKTNINEQHTVAAQADFDVMLLQARTSEPLPITVTLADLKDANDRFIFDTARLAGAEHYQGALLKIEHVHITAGTWGPGQQLTIADDAGRSLPLLLGRGSGFTIYPAPGGTISVLGIFDQEDGIEGDGFKAGYRLWAMDYDGINLVVHRYVKPDVDRDGDVDAADRAHFEACVTGPAIQQARNDCLNADFDGDGDVDQDDFGMLQRCWSGVDRLAGAFCDQ